MVIVLAGIEVKAFVEEGAGYIPESLCALGRLEKGGVFRGKGRIVACKTHIYVKQDKETFLFGGV